MKRISVFISALLLFSTPLSVNAEEDQAKSKAKEKSYPSISATTELGFLSVIDHKIQFGQQGTYFDYKKDGGQSNLYAISKYSLDVEFNSRHKLVLLYQPLSLASRTVLEQDVRQDNVTFTKGTPMNFIYDFPFFRGSYLYDFNEDEFEELSVGLSLQLRNANIEFESLDGTKLIARRNVGPVPILKFRSRNRINQTWWYGSDVDGFYAPISYLNGSNNQVIGAILDANVKVGANIQDKYYPYLNLRYIGGGGVGTSNDKNTTLSDGFSNNWLHFFVLTLGITTDLI